MRKPINYETELHIYLAEHPNNFYWVEERYGKRRVYRLDSPQNAMNPNDWWWYLEQHVIRIWVDKQPTLLERIFTRWPKFVAI